MILPDAIFVDNKFTSFGSFIFYAIALSGSGGACGTVVQMDCANVELQHQYDYDLATVFCHGRGTGL